MQTLADELEDASAIRANSINPGGTRTAMRATAYPAEDPTTRPAPAEHMPLYLYLMGDDSVGVNGEQFDAETLRVALRFIFNVAGGLRLGRHAQGGEPGPPRPGPPASPR